MNPIGVYVPILEVFPNVQHDFATFQSLVRQLSRTDALFWCARLNLILSNPTTLDHQAQQAYGIRMIFAPEEIGRIRRFARAHRDVQGISVFFRGQLLELMRWVCLWCDDQADDGTTFERPEVRRIFAQAVLMATDLWNRRVYGDRFSLEGGRDTARKRALGAIRAAITETSSGMDPLLALGRAQVLIGTHLARFYPDLAEDFRTCTLLSLEDYYSCLTAFMTTFLNRTPENTRENPGIFNVHTLCASAPHVQPMIATYLALESQTPDELRYALWGQRRVTRFEEAGRYDYKPLRQRPILQASDGRAIILDPVLYAEKAAVGPLFRALDGAPKLKSNAMFAAFGHAFETYAHGILRRMYPQPSPGLVDRLCYDVQGRNSSGQAVQIADACLNDVTEAILFEMKAVWLQDVLILDENHERYLDLLREKYGCGAGREAGSQVKGVGQLGRAIYRLASGEWTPLVQDFTMVKRIYPVLVVHDPYLDAPVHGEFFAEEFAKALAPDETLANGEMRKGHFRVAPLIVMTIDDLERLETSIEHFSLHDLLRDYSMSYPDRVASLHNYLATSKYRNKIYHSRSMASQTLEVLERSKRMIFPNHLC